MKSTRSVVGSLAIAVSSVFLLSACQSVEVTQDGAVLTANASDQAQILWFVYNDEFLTERGPAKTLVAAFLRDWPDDDETLLAYENAEFDCDTDAFVQAAESPEEIALCTDLAAVEAAIVGLFQGGKIAGAEGEGSKLDLDVANFSGLEAELPEGWDGCGYYVKALVQSEGDTNLGGLRANLQWANDFLAFFEPNTTTTDFTCKDEVGLSATAPATTIPPTLAKTGAEVEWMIFAGLFSALAGAGFLTVSRRKRI